MNSELFTALCAAFIAPQVIYGVRWWKGGGGRERLFRHMSYAFFVGFMVYLFLFMVKEFFKIHFLGQVLISILGSFLYLKSDYYFNIVKGTPPPKSKSFFIGGFWKDPESVKTDLEGLESNQEEKPKK